MCISFYSLVLLFVYVDGEQEPKLALRPQDKRVHVMLSTLWGENWAKVTIDIFLANVKTCAKPNKIRSGVMLPPL